LDFSTARLFHGLAGRQFRVEDRTAALVIHLCEGSTR
jgi:hypothetical protein